jgi:hypothetical protein
VDELQNIAARNSLADMTPRPGLLPLPEEDDRLTNVDSPSLVPDKPLEPASMSIATSTVWDGADDLL